MKRLYYANASDTPPLPPKNPSYGYPQDGDRSLHKLPTVLGSYWHHMITEEFMNVIEGAGLEPDEHNLHQLADIFEDFRQRAFKAEGFAGDAQDWANKAKEFAEAAQAEADSKVALVREAGEAQVAAVNAATEASQEEIEKRTKELEQKLQTLIEALDAKGGEQVNLVKMQAQEILDAIRLTKNQVEELVNSAGYSMRWLADAHEGINLTATLTPATNAKVGDHVINTQGEVFELLELKGTEILLGPVLAVFGDVGPMGPSPDVSIEVNMIGPDQTASVEKSGTEAVPHFKLNIPQGKKGAAFVYSDFTEEQLEALKGPKGDTGASLTFADLTDEQKAELKGEGLHVQGTFATYEELLNSVHWEDAKEGDLYLAGTDLYRCTPEYEIGEITGKPVLDEDGNPIVTGIAWEKMGTIVMSEDTSGLVPKTGDRGVLNGYENRGYLEVWVNGSGGIEAEAIDFPNDAYRTADDGLVLEVFIDRMPDACFITAPSPVDGEQPALRFILAVGEQMTDEDIANGKVPAEMLMYCTKLIWVIGFDVIDFKMRENAGNGEVFVPMDFTSTSESFDDLNPLNSTFVLNVFNNKGTLRVLHSPS